MMQWLGSHQAEPAMVSSIQQKAEAGIRNPLLLNELKTTSEEWLVETVSDLLRNIVGTYWNFLNCLSLPNFRWQELAWNRLEKSMMTRKLPLKFPLAPKHCNKKENK